MNILIVDDHPTNRKLLRAQLESEGHVVLEAANGIEALTVLAGGSVAAIISDVLMPRMDGYQLCHEVRVSPHFYSLPFIIYTATYTSEADEKLAFDVGADKYLKKPASADTILSTLRETLSAPARRQHSPVEVPQELSLMKEYNEQLVKQLEGKNWELSMMLEKLQASEERLRMIVQTEPECVKIVSPTGQLLEMNPAGLAMLEADSLEEACSHPLSEFLAPEYRSDFSQMHKQVMAGESGRIELEVIGLKGTRRWLDIYAVPLRDKLGKIRSLLGISRDVTERKKAERSLVAAEAKFRNLVEQSLVGIYIIQDDRFVYANPTMTAIFGVSEAEFAVRSLYDFVYEADRELVKSNIRQRFSGEIEGVRYALRMLHSDGKVLNVEAHGSRGEFNGRPAIIGTLLDVTQRRSLERQLQQAQKMDAIGTLAGGIAHDFNNVLSAINGYTELAKIESERNPKVLDYLDAVSRAGCRAADLVRQILTFSRQQEQERKPVQIRHVIGEAFKLLRATIPATIEFKLSLATNTPVVLADASQVHQIVMNLGTNAAHAMRQQTGYLDVKLENFTVDTELAGSHPDLQCGRYARLSIKDNGHGMDAKTVERIFEPFFTTKAPGEGTGLGLSVVHGIMKAHDGCITVHSEPGRGTIFQLYFPALATEEPEVTPGAAAHPCGQGEQILFLDDEEPLVKLGKLMLERFGYAVQTETNPLVALSRIRANPTAYSLVITDLTMPRMTGIELAKQILEIRPDLPIILITGYTADLTTLSVQAMGIREMLLKPVSRQAFGETIHRVLTAARNAKIRA